MRAKLFRASYELGWRDGATARARQVDKHLLEMADCVGKYQANPAMERLLSSTLLKSAAERLRRLDLPEPSKETT